MGCYPTGNFLNLIVFGHVALTGNPILERSGRARNGTANMRAIFARAASPSSTALLIRCHFLAAVLAFSVCTGHTPLPSVTKMRLLGWTSIWWPPVKSPKDGSTVMSSVL